MIFITRIKLFGLNERAIEEARWKVKKEIETRFACIETVPFARKVNVTMLILMKTVIFICRGRHEGIASVETYRDRQGQTRTDRDIQGQTGTDRDRQGQTRTDRDRQGQTRTRRDIQGQTRTSRDKNTQTGTNSDKQGQKENVPV